MLQDGLEVVIKESVDVVASEELKVVEDIIGGRIVVEYIGGRADGVVGTLSLRIC